MQNRDEYFQSYQEKNNHSKLRTITKTQRKKNNLDLSFFMRSLKYLHKVTSILC